MKIYSVLVAVLLMTGCATVDKSTGEMAKGADTWCLTVPESMRLAERDAINELTQIATVRIDCE